MDKKKLQSLLNSPWGARALSLCVGATIGLLAWGPGRSAALAAVLPLAVMLAGSRAQAFLMTFGYLLGAGRLIPDYSAGWYDGNLFIGTCFLLAVACVGGAMWALGWTASDRPWRKALGVFVGWTLSLLPPAAAVLPGHPVIAWGFITPGWGWFGVAMSVIAPAAAIWVITQEKLAKRLAVASTTVAAALLAGSSLLYAKEENRYVSDFVAVGTEWGLARDPFDIIERIERMGVVTGRLAKDNLASVVIWPESIVQRYAPSLFQVLRLELLGAAAKAGQTVVIGADVPTKDGNMENAAIAFYPDGRTSMAVARQTVPVALWKPWKGHDSFLSNWGASNMLTLKNGIRARVIFCYEEFIPILSLINEALDPHEVVVVMTNSWAAKDPASAEIQNRHSEGVARLFGRKVLKAENRPRKAG